ncbi:MAG: hypothetical protein LUE86_03020 [Clostridiales bacterium]|nr:hypothetical protein [Clostridiales bacterium]
MAYFDSSKNRALWEIRLEELKEARERRQNSQEADISFRKNAPATESFRVRTSYQELLAEELEATRTRQRTGREREKKTFQAERKKEGPAHEMR